MKFIFKIMLISIVILLTMTLSSCTINSTISTKKGVSRISYNKDSTTVKFKGVITNVKNDCWVDGTCKIEVNNWWIAIIYGKRDPSFRLKERGVVTGIRFTKNNESIGKKVKVYAKIRGKNRLTLEGNNNYYVEVIE